MEMKELQTRFASSRELDGRKADIVLFSAMYLKPVKDLTLYYRPGLELWQVNLTHRRIEIGTDGRGNLKVEVAWKSFRYDLVNQPASLSTDWVDDVWTALPKLLDALIQRIPEVQDLDLFYSQRG